MVVCPVQIISRLESQNKFQMYRECTPTWRLHTGLYKFYSKYFEEYLRFGKTHRLKNQRIAIFINLLNITISCLYLLNGFRIYIYFFIASELHDITRSKNCFTGVNIVSFFHLEVAQNNFQHFPRRRFRWANITTLYKSMLQSWYKKKTAQSLVNTLALIRDTIGYHSNTVAS